MRMRNVGISLLFVAVGLISCSDDDGPTQPPPPTVSQVPISNADFEVLFKAGSTTATAPPLLSTQFVSGVSNLGMTGPTVTFSDSTTGNTFDLDGWTFTELMGIANEDGNFATSGGNIALFNGALFGGGVNAKSMSQVLGQQLEQGKPYTLTADFGWRNDNAEPSGPPILNLYAGDSLLVPTLSLSPDLVQGSFVTYSRTYLVNNNMISGALRVEIGLGANTNGRQLNADRVGLSKL